MSAFPYSRFSLSIKRLTRLAFLFSVLLLATGCSEVSIFLGLADKAGTVQSVSLTADGHFQISMKKSTRIKNPDMGIYISKTEDMPSQLLGLTKIENFQGPVAFVALDVPSSMAPSKDENSFVQAVSDDSVVVNKDVESGAYYLIEIKNRNRSIQRYKTSLAIVRAYIAPVSGIIATDRTASVEIAWTASEQATEYEIFADAEGKEILATTSATAQTFTKAEIGDRKQLWLRAKRGMLVSKPLTAVDLPITIAPGSDTSIITAVPVPSSVPATSDSTPPVVDSGADLIVRSITTVTGSAQDLESGVATYAWTQRSGPGVISFGSANALSTTVSASVDGSYVLRLTVTDSAGNSAFDELSFEWDTTAPTSPSSPGFPTSYSNSLSVSPTWGVSTDLHLIAYNSKLCTANDCINGCLSEVFSATASAVHTAVEGGVYYACVQAEDSPGNQSPFVPSFLTVTVDTLAPTSTSISIAGGSVYSSTTSLALTLAASAATQMYITNTSGCASGGVWESYATSKAWSLAQSNGTAEVFAKFRDAAGNESACISDTIIHDNIAPTSESISINGNAASTTSTSVTLTLGVSDTNPKEMYISNTAGCASNGSWETYATTKSWTLGQTNGTATVYVSFRDAAGNTSSCINDTITHNLAAPSGASVSINAGAGSTTSEALTLTLAATNATEMYVTRDYGCDSGGTWETFSASKIFNGVISYGELNVYVKYRNAANVESACVSDDINFTETYLGSNRDFSGNLTNWTQSPTNTFTRVNTAPITDGYYARSNPSMAGSRNCISQAIDLSAETADHKLEFSWTYSIGTNSDMAEFLVDGTRIYSGDGDLDWTVFSTTLTAGASRNLQWCFDNVQGLSTSFIGLDKIRISKLRQTAPVFDARKFAGGMEFTSTKSSNLETGYLLVAAPANSSTTFYPRDGQVYTNGSYEGDNVYVGSPTLARSISGMQKNDQLFVAIFSYDSSYNYSAPYTQVYIIDNFYYGVPNFRIEGRSSQTYLQWDAAPADSGVTGYIILRQPNLVVGYFNDGQSYSVGEVVNGSTVVYKGTSLNFSDNTVTNGTKYNYQLYAIGPGGNVYKGIGWEWISPQACGGVSWGNACWYLSAPSQSCKDLCTANSAEFDYTSMEYYLYQKTASDCQNLATNLGFFTPPASSIRTINTQKPACSISGTQLSYSSMNPTYSYDGARAESYQSICACN